MLTGLMESAVVLGIFRWAHANEGLATARPGPSPGRVGGPRTGMILR